MGFDDLPIPNNGTTHTVTNPLGLATVANYTRNPILDVGYQCKDCRPYFAFTNSSTTYYIRIHPDNLTANDEISMYTASSITKFGITYTKMTKSSGHGTVLTTGSSATISYNNVTYTYNSQGDVDVFLNKLNPWAFYKPYDYPGLTDDELGQTRCSDLESNPITDNWDRLIKSYIHYGFNYNRENTVTNIYCGSYSTALTNASATNSVWNYKRPTTIFRLTDFIGYNKNATCPGRCGEWSESKKIIKVSNANIGFEYSYNASDAEIDIFAMDQSLRTDTWYVGAIISKVALSGTSVSSRQFSDFYLAGAVNDVFPANPVGDVSDAAIEVALLHGTGDYEVCWVLSRRNTSNVNQNQPYIILPYGYFLLNYSLQNQDILIVPYNAVFESTYPDAVFGESYVDFSWSVGSPARTTNMQTINVEESRYTSVKFFFTIINNSETIDYTGSNSITLTIENSLSSSISPTVTKTISINRNSHYNVVVQVPVSIAQELGNGISGDAHSGVGFRVSYQYGSSSNYIDIVNGVVTRTNPGYQYLYTSMDATNHWFLDSECSYIWGSNGLLNSYAPALNDSSLIAI